MARGLCDKLDFVTHHAQRNELSGSSTDGKPTFSPGTSAFPNTGPELVGPRRTAPDPNQTQSAFPFDLARGSLIPGCLGRPGPTLHKPKHNVDRRAPGLGNPRCEFISSKDFRDRIEHGSPENIAVFCLDALVDKI